MATAAVNDFTLGIGWGLLGFACAAVAAGLVRLAQVQIAYYRWRRRARRT